MLLQGIQQWQGKDAAEADGEEPGLPVHIHGWSQCAVGKVKHPEGLGPGGQWSGHRLHRTYSLCFSQQGFVCAHMHLPSLLVVDPSSCPVRAFEGAVPTAKYLQGSLTHPSRTLLNSPISANVSQPHALDSGRTPGL